MRESRSKMIFVAAPVVEWDSLIEPFKLLGKIESIENLQSRKKERPVQNHLHMVHIENIAPNFNYNDEAGGVHSYTNQRLGRKCNLKAVNVKHRNIWRDCLSQEGPRLFNALPKSLRNLTNPDGTNRTFDRDRSDQ